MTLVIIYKFVRQFAKRAACARSATPGEPHVCVITGMTDL